MRAYGKHDGVRLGTIGKGRETHYIVYGTVMCGKYTKLSDKRQLSPIAILPADDGQHIEASCHWCRRIAEDD